jgi:hypothetical protein
MAAAIISEDDGLNDGHVLVTATLRVADLADQVLIRGSCAGRPFVAIQRHRYDEATLRLRHRVSCRPDTDVDGVAASTTAQEQISNGAVHGQIGVHRLPPEFVFPPIAMIGIGVMRSIAEVIAGLLGDGPWSFRC